MLVAFFVTAALTLLILTIWVLRRHNALLNAAGVVSLHRVDTLAFHNLLSEEDEEYLRRSLSQAEYRRVRRARIRAMQEYLIWIAEDCATLTALLHLDAAAAPSQPEAIAIRLRLTSIALWSLLWIEYVIPAFVFRPGRTLAAYEDFRRAAENYLANKPLQPAIAARRA